MKEIRQFSLWKYVTDFQIYEACGLKAITAKWPRYINGKQVEFEKRGDVWGYTKEGHKISRKWTVQTKEDLVKAEFVARITEGLEQRKLAEKCQYVGNPYFEYVRECKTRKRRNLKRKFYR